MQQHSATLNLPTTSRMAHAKAHLLWVLDETLTPMGGRFLRSSVLKPLTDINEIKKRLDAVEYLSDDFELLEELRTSLRKIQDIERLSSRVNAKSANARDLIAIKISIVHLPKIKKSLTSSKNIYSAVQFRGYI